MTERLPRVTAKDVSKVLERIGFSLVRQSGSHMIYKNAEGKRITIPYHSGKILHHDHRCYFGNTNRTLSPENGYC